MDRFHVRNSVMGNKRALGRRIKRGLEELGSLDVSGRVPKRERKEEEDGVVTRGNEPLKKKIKKSNSEQEEKRDSASSRPSKGVGRGGVQGASFSFISTPKQDATQVMDRTPFNACTSSGYNRHSDSNSCASSEEEHEGGSQHHESMCPVDVFEPSLKDWKHAKQLLLTANRTTTSNNNSSNNSRHKDPPHLSHNHNEDIRSASILAKRNFLMYCELWHARARPNRPLPPYIEASELLVQAMLLDSCMDQLPPLPAPSTLSPPPLLPISSPFPHDDVQMNTAASTDSNDNNSSSLFPAFGSSPLFFSSRMIRLFYGAALSRIVHVLTGTFTKSEALNTYRKRAKEIGLPEEVVEVRQRVAHGSVPCITELRWVASMTWAYLHQQWWIPEERRYDDKQRQEEQKKKKTTYKVLPERREKGEVNAVDTCLSREADGEGREKHVNDVNALNAEVPHVLSSSERDFSVTEMMNFLDALPGLSTCITPLKEEEEEEESSETSNESNNSGGEAIEEDEISNTSGKRSLIMGWEIC